jgi:hypothetical protein
MLFMAVGLSFGALLLGAMADRLRKLNIRTEVLLAGVGALFMLAELALILRVQLPSFLPWSTVSLAGAATVLSFAVVADYFPKEFAARSNGALNLLHFGWAFSIQYGIGFVVGQWPSQEGHYPVVAYQVAFGLTLALQAAALVWFAMPWIRTFGWNASGESPGKARRIWRLFNGWTHPRGGWRGLVSRASVGGASRPQSPILSILATRPETDRTCATGAPYCLPFAPLIAHQVRESVAGIEWGNRCGGAIDVEDLANKLHCWRAERNIACHDASVRRVERRNT